jgi:hypothetical protein
MLNVPLALSEPSLSSSKSALGFYGPVSHSLTSPLDTYP